MVRKDINLKENESLVLYQIGNYKFNCKLYTNMVSQFLEKIENTAERITVIQNNRIFNFYKK